MNQEMELIRNEDRKYFIKNFNLKIPMYKSPYFEYFIELYKDYDNTDKKYKIFEESLNILKTKNKTIKGYSYELLNIITDTIKKIPSYNDFLKENKYCIEGQLPNDINLYVNNNANWSKYYISLDIIKANFNSLKFYDEKLVLESQNWEEFIRKFTDISYFVEAKYFRQIIFGNLNMKKISHISKFLLGEFYKIIKNKVSVLGKVSMDEMIISTTKETIKEDYYKLIELINLLPENMRNIWRIVPFILEPIGKSQGFIKKEILDIEKSYEDKTNIKFEIKNIERDFHAQAYKYYTNQNVTEHDKKSMLNGYIITYEDYFKFD